MVASSFHPKLPRLWDLLNSAGRIVHLLPLPALADNYIWLLHDDQKNAVVIDPGDAGVVERALAAHKLQLRAILLTHHHPDHTDGMPSLRERHQVPVYAPADERIEPPFTQVGDHDHVELRAPAVRFDVIALPGHTLSHIAFVGAGLLFCGDTLFSLGCGRVFEGTAEQMTASLDRLAQLPAETLVCAGHEYTEANGRFALSVDPANPDLSKRLHEVAELRRTRQPSLPTKLGSELACNPFLRMDAPAVIAWARHQGCDGDRVARFAALRRAKDEFRS